MVILKLRTRSLPITARACAPTPLSLVNITTGVVIYPDPSLTILTATICNWLLITATAVAVAPA